MSSVQPKKNKTKEQLEKETKEQPTDHHMEKKRGSTLRVLSLKYVRYVRFPIILIKDK